MPPTIPSEEMRTELKTTLKEVSRLTLLCSCLAMVIDNAHDYNPAELDALLAEYRTQLKLKETRKAQLQDELEKQSNP